MTERTVLPPATRLESGKPARVWYGIAGAPFAWVIQSALHWFVASRACADGDGAWGPLGAGAVRLLLVGLAAAAFAAALAGVLFSLRAWRETSDTPHLTAAHGHGVTEYLATAGLLISAVFLLAIVWTALPAAMVSVCEGAR